MIIKKKDWGTPLIIEIKDEKGNVEDISGATIKKMIFKKPDGARVSKVAEFYTDGTDGKIQYKLSAGLINISGLWKYEGFVETPEGAWSTTMLEFTVDEIL